MERGMSANKYPVRLGIIGCGNVTQNRHLPAIQSLKNLQVVALADIDHDRLDKAGNKYGITSRYSDYQALLDDREVEAVAVCVPLNLHVEVALAALDAGKHVFVEKPLAPSLASADALIERAAGSLCVVLVGYNLRFHRHVRKALEMMQSGQLGRIEMVVATFTAGTRFKSDVLEWKKRRALGGGVFMEFATHYFDLWRFLLRSEVEEVFATSRSDQWDDVTGTLTARLSDGVLAIAYFSEWTTEGNELHIFGQRGSLHLSLYRFDGFGFIPLFTAPGQVRNRLSKVIGAFRHIPRAASHFRRGGDYYASFIEQWRHFASSIRERAALECTLDDGRRALEVALAAAESSSTGQPVRIGQASGRIP
jgi:myo-inositol 2-dehydrogenase/D-chiro-inositol 1-dehydrogenase